MMIDTHAHLYSEQYANQTDVIIKNALKAGVNKIFMPCISSEDIPPMIWLNRQYPDVCYPMVGLHPCDVKENYKEELFKLEEAIKDNRFYAVGEAGLDYFHDVTFKEEQKIAFKEQISWCSKYNLPLVIHSRNSNEEVLEILENNLKKGTRGVFHCFSGSLEQAQRVIKLGFLLGIGGVVTFKNAHLYKTVIEIDLEHLVLETDAPFLAPTPHRGKTNEPSYLGLIADKIAEAKNISPLEVKRATTANALKLFGLEG
jgi:TatD DNase family protein